ncbi:cysteine desulfurase [Ruminococcaceae bacterium OttesenSCG-928-N02]|nr:cysteine desulfurase [Ruminococcaceae bacterium OttesenSCG-928-N02]
MHYLDNAATTAVSPAVAAVISTAMTECFGNPSSLYRLGVQSEQALEKARGVIANSLGCLPKEIYFTACGTEGNNIAIQGALAARAAWCKKIVCTGFEHPSVHKQIERFEKAGMQVVWVAPAQDGTLSADAIVDAVDDTTGLVTFLQVNNEIGTVLPAADIARRVKAANPRTAVHVDGVQAWGRIAVSLSNTEIDSYSVSGHKVHAPKGVGALYLRSGHNITPPFLGGGQERGMRPGTENIPYILGLAHAAGLFAGKEEEQYVHVQALYNQAREGLESLPNIQINSPQGGIAHVLNISVLGYKSEPLLHFLEGKGVYVSSGSACSKGAASHTLLAMNLPAARIDSALRISFCAQNVPQDVTALLAALQEGMGTLLRVN